MLRFFCCFFFCRSRSLFAIYYKSKKEEEVELKREYDKEKERIKIMIRYKRTKLDVVIIIIIFILFEYKSIYQMTIYLTVFYPFLLLFCKLYHHRFNSSFKNCFFFLSITCERLYTILQHYDGSFHIFFSYTLSFVKEYFVEVFTNRYKRERVKVI